MFSQKGHVFFVVLLLGIWLVMLCIAGPLHDFPLNDDWMYSRTVTTIFTGNYRVADEYSPVLVTQAYWGALFCLPFGFSFIALRLSALVLGIIGVIVFYAIINKLSGSKPLAFFCGLLLMGNPLFFCLANSFMTDVPFLSFTLIAFYFFFIMFEKPNVFVWLLAGVATICATLTRQFGMVIPIAFTVTGLLQKGKSVFKWIIYIMPVVGVTWLLVFTLGRLGGKGWYPYNGNSMARFLSSSALFLQIVQRCGMILYYSGFFLLPLLLLLRNPFKDLSSKQKMALGIFILVGISFLLCAWQVVPVGNVFNTSGLGPKTLKGGVENPPGLAPGVTLILKCLGFAGAIVLLGHVGVAVLKIVKRYMAGDVDDNSRQKTFMVLCLIGYALLSFVPDFFFDRYILFFSPLLALLIIPGQYIYAGVKTPVAIGACMMVFIFALFSAAGTHDYIAWNQARWDAANYLTEECKISPHKIDGGYEYNGWVIGKWYPLDHGKSWWFVDDDEYVITFNKLDGYKTIKQFSYKNYFPFEERNILVLQRK